MNVEPLRSTSDSGPQEGMSRFSELETLYRTAPVGLAFIGPDLRYLRINEHLAHLNGRPIQEHIGKTVREVIPQFADRVEPLLQRVLTSGKPVIDIEMSGQRPADRTHTGHWRVNYYPVTDNGGHVIGVSAVVQDVTHLKEQKLALAQQLEFERIVSELSAMLIRLPPEEIDSKIEDGLGLIGRFMGVDRCFIDQYSEDQTEFRVTHMWTADGIPHDEFAFSVALSDYVPWYTKPIFRGESFIFSSPQELPEDATAEREYVARTGIRSSAIVPLIVGGTVIGSFGLDMLREERRWSGDVLPRLQLASEMFASAIMRQRDQMGIEAARRFERRISEISSTFVNVESEKVDRYITDGLARIGECLDTDLATVLLYDAERKCYQVTHEWIGSALQPGPIFLGLDVNAAFPWLERELGKRKPLFIHRLDQWPEDASIERAGCEAVGIRSVLWVPFEVGDKILGYVALNTTRQEKFWSQDFIQRLRLVGEIFGNALLRKRSDQALEDAFAEIKQLKDRLETDNLYLRSEVELTHKYDEFIGKSRPIRVVLGQAERVAPTNSAVLLLGETGTGKELLARLIHALSGRKDRPMIKVNCAALPATLIEAELFGREKGAYTGALSKQIGRFKIADGSTLFLDEVGELPLELQAKLLRVLQDGEFEPLGSSRTQKVDVRVIAATNRDLEAAVRDGAYREDLFYRLNVFPISVPPLRKRQADIPALVWKFVQEFGDSVGRSIESIPAKAMESLQRYSWPGNVRELRNVIERAMILSPGSTLQVELPAERVAQSTKQQSLEAVECAHIERILTQTNWCIAGKFGAAEILGLKPTTLRSRMERLGVPTSKRPQH